MPTESDQSATRILTESPSTQSRAAPANYRHFVLKRAEIYVRFWPAPEKARAQIHAVIQPKLASDDKENLALIAQRMSDRFLEILDQPAGEDDCLGPLQTTLLAMDYSKSLTLQLKADWEVALKPRFRPWLHDLSLLNQPQQELEQPGGRASKRQQIDSAYISPGTSGPDPTGAIDLENEALVSQRMPPPRRRPAKVVTAVKTPRPDISIGLHDDGVVRALQSQGLTAASASELINSLQTTDSADRSEPLLCSNPTTRGLNIRFPFLIVEGKGYATGGTIFEAQNQVAVSGACALNIIHDLNDLVYRANPRGQSDGQPIVFSICTEGPYHELWAHYTAVEDGVRKYHMTILKTCNAALVNDLSGFVEAVDNVMRWGAGDFLDNLAGKLGEVADATKLPVE